MEVDCLNLTTMGLQLQCFELVTVVRIVCFVGKGLAKTLAYQANVRIASGLRPRTFTTYLVMFKHFLAFVVFMRLQFCIL